MPSLTNFRLSWLFGSQATRTSYRVEFGIGLFKLFVGNYQLIERPGLRPPPGIYRPPDEEADATKEEEEPEPEAEKAPSPEQPPKPETPWERGLRQAKDVGLYDIVII